MSGQYSDPKLKIFALNSNKPLAEKIAEAVGVPLGKSLLIVSVMVKSVSTLKKVFVAMKYLSFNQHLLLLMII